MSECPQYLIVGWFHSAGANREILLNTEVASFQRGGIEDHPTIQNAGAIILWLHVSAKWQHTSIKGPPFSKLRHKQVCHEDHIIHPTPASSSYPARMYTHKDHTCEFPLVFLSTATHTNTPEKWQGMVWLCQSISSSSLSRLWESKMLQDDDMQVGLHTLFTSHSTHTIMDMKREL